ncbi:hypothetical protein [Streptomyces sp. NRRL F-5123]|uniref:hypothetical protein n=1 Tax=Streptomyces sp. NRRL F-5123 TaxID=1463856 RepID=UPI000694195A|nr:hypothetical protein [Streptomyces sp. NRRL F-5123]
MDSSNPFAAAIRRLTDGEPPRPGEPVVLTAPQDADLRGLVAEMTRLAGRHRNLAAGGLVDPTLTERTGLPLTEAFAAGELLELRGWPLRDRWLGCGLAATARGPRTVAVAAHRADPAVAGFPPGTTWAGKLRAVTGWEPIPGPRVQWPAIEAALGARLPADYKEIADVFGEGSFDDYVDLVVPAPDLTPWTPSDLAGPASDGLLTWASSEQGLAFCWRATTGDPDAWPVVARAEGREDEQHACGAGEFLLRVLTDVRLGRPVSRARDHHFTSFGTE